MKGTSRKHSTQKASTMTEYALLCSLIALTLVGAIRFFQEKLQGKYRYIYGAVENPASVDNGAGGGEECVPGPDVEC